MFSAKMDRAVAVIQAGNRFLALARKIRLSDGRLAGGDWCWLGYPATLKSVPAIVLARRW